MNQRQKSSAPTMKIVSNDFRVSPSATLKLGQWPTLVKPFYKTKEHYRELLDDHVSELSKLQELLYASNTHAVLLIFQAMDSAGKDGAIRHVMSGINPQGCQVFSFAHPSAEELDHDFLWRTTRCLPERGRFGIFNRSYYEEVLIVRVHPEILKAQRLPPEAPGSNDLWKDRFESIRGLEKHLHRNGTQVIKFFLHLSKEEQRQRLLQRIETPEKNWKFSASDIRERGLWDQYMRAYEACLGATSTKTAPWYVVPADDKKNARLIISHIVVDTLKALKMRYPEPSKAQRSELESIRKVLLNEKA